MVIRSSMMSPQNTRRIEVGDEVVLVGGVRRNPARVIEDPGYFGNYGERYLHIVIDFGDGTDKTRLDAPESRLELVNRAE